MQSPKRRKREEEAEAVSPSHSIERGGITEKGQIIRTPSPKTTHSPAKDSQSCQDDTHLSCAFLPRLKSDTSSPIKSQWINYSPRPRGRPRKKMLMGKKRTPSPLPPAAVPRTPPRVTPRKGVVVPKPVSVRKIMPSPRRNLRGKGQHSPPYDLRESTLENLAMHRSQRGIRNRRCKSSNLSMTLSSPLHQYPPNKSARKEKERRRAPPSPRTPVPTPPNRGNKSTSRFAVNTIARSSPRFR